MYKFIIIFLFIILTGCDGESSPSDIYEEYSSNVIKGISFDEEKQYFSVSKLKEVEASFSRYMNQMNKSKEEVIEFYLVFSQSVSIYNKV
jgi:hypothetical protein